jgi:hypothetical protein
MALGMDGRGKYRWIDLPTAPSLVMWLDAVVGSEIDFQMSCVLDGALSLQSISSSSHARRQLQFCRACQNSAYVGAAKETTNYCHLFSSGLGVLDTSASVYYRSTPASWLPTRLLIPVNFVTERNALHRSRLLHAHSGGHVGSADSCFYIKAFSGPMLRHMSS